MPNLADNWHDKVMQVYTKEHRMAVQDTKMCFSFELYGTNNAHAVKYDQFDGDYTLRLDLLTIFDYKKSLKRQEVQEIADEYNIKTVDRSFKLRKVYNRAFYYML
jgi:hypothetical protein